MARIPTGNFGQRVAGSLQLPNVPRENVLGDAVRRATGAGMQVAEDMANREQTAQRQQDAEVRADATERLRAEDAEARQAAEAAMRAKTITALTGARDVLADAHDDVNDRVIRGELGADVAESEFGKRAQKALEGVAKDLPEDRRAIVLAELNGDAARLANGVRKAVTQRNRMNVTASIDTALESLQRQYRTDPDSATKQARLLMESLGPQSTLTPEQRAGKLQVWQERTQFELGSSLLTAAGDNMARLKAVGEALANRDYLPDMDPQRRQALIGSVEGRIDLVQRRAALAVEQREAKAERAIASAQRQLSSGVPLTTQGWDALRAATRGTAVEAEFTGLVQSERDIQQLLRKPVTEQVAEVQRRQAALMQQGGTMAEAANINRLSEAVQRNVKTLQQEPLQFAAQRAGVEVKPLALELLLQPGGAGALRGEVMNRVTTVDGLRRQYGDAVPMQVLQPAEAKQVARILNESPVSMQTALLAQLRTLAGGDTRVFSAMMQQVAPDSPVKALAGLIADKQASATVDRRTLSSDVVRSAGDISSTLLRGEAILSPGSADKAQDGKPRTNLFLPDTATFNAALVGYVGTAFAERPAALQAAQQAVLAYYVGRAAELGRLNKDAKDIDSGLVREALAATLGEPVERVGGMVFAPWGMGADEFQAQARAAFRQELQARGMADSNIHRWPGLGLKQQGGDTYLVTEGRALVLDSQNRPITIRVPGPGEPLRDGRGVPLRDSVIPTAPR